MAVRKITKAISKEVEDKNTQEQQSISQAKEQADEKNEPDQESDESLAPVRPGCRGKPGTGRAGERRDRNAENPCRTSGTAYGPARSIAHHHGKDADGRGSGRG